MTFSSALFTTPFPSSWSGMTNLTDFTWSGASSQAPQPFPSFLQGMQALKKIEISNVNMNGSVPSFVGSLPSLTSLILSGITNIVGPIPDSIANSSTLQTLQLVTLSSFDQGSSSSMPSDWSQANALSDMVFQYVPITGSLPPIPPPKLVTFTASRTRLSGTIPQAFIDVLTLQSFSIDVSEVNGTIPAPSDLENSYLETYLIRSSLVTSIDDNILRTKRLRYLTFGNNDLLNVPLPSKVGFSDSINSDIRSLNFVGNKLVGSIPSSIFANSPNLNAFYAQNNNLSGELPSSITKFNKLLTLDVSSNSLSGQIPGAGNWSELTQLRTLIVRNNSFTGSIPSGLFQRPESAIWTAFDFSFNRLDICLLPENATLRTPTVCTVVSQTPTSCGCPDQWPSSWNCQVEMNATCPPLEPIPVAPEFTLNLPTPDDGPAIPSGSPSPSSPSSPSSPAPSPSPSGSYPVPSPSTGSSPSSPAPGTASSPSSSANKLQLQVATFVFALAAFISLVLA